MTKFELNGVTAVLNDTKWETWLGEVIMKTKEIHTTKEI